MTAAYCHHRSLHDADPAELIIEVDPTASYDTTIVLLQ